MRIIYATILVLCAGLVVTGCGRSSSNTSTTNVSTTTAGQELEDLKAAFDSGVISEEEYEEKRQQILDSE